MIKRNRNPLPRKAEKQERSRSEHQPSQSWRPREETRNQVTEYGEKQEAGKTEKTENGLLNTMRAAFIYVQKL